MLTSSLFKKFSRSFVAIGFLSSVNPALAESPISHCASARVDDRTMPIPAAMVGQATALLELRNADANWVRKTTVYRYMNGAAWLCNRGANLTCAKADVRRIMPNVTAYCRQNPEVEAVPMVVTGHGAINIWGCVGGKARVKQSKNLDQRGFIADQWKRLLE